MFYKAVRDKANLDLATPGFEMYEQALRTKWPFLIYKRTLVRVAQWIKRWTTNLAVTLEAEIFHNCKPDFITIRSLCYKFFLCSTQPSMKFFLLINVKIYEREKEHSRLI